MLKRLKEWWRTSGWVVGAYDPPGHSPYAEDDEMTWTSEYPTKPGYYWIRNYQLIPYDDLILSPHIVAIEAGNTGLLCYLTGSGDFFLSSEITGEWLGPILPPDDDKQYESVSTEQINAELDESIEAWRKRAFGAQSPQEAGK